MNLLELRTKFIQLSGRYDLATSTFADAGADFFLKAGQEHLDRFFGGDEGDQKSLARGFIKVRAGGIGAVVEHCRAIKAVWAHSADTRWELEKRALRWIHENFPKPLSSSGTPKYYAPAVIRPTPRGEDLSAKDWDLIAEYGDLLMLAEHRYNGVVIAPATDSEISLEIWGLFYTPWPKSDNGENFWMHRHPDLLILASLYKLETLFHRNSEGAKDYLNALNEALIGIDKDIVEEQMAYVTQLEG